MSIPSALPNARRSTVRMRGRGYEVAVEEEVMVGGKGNRESPEGQDKEAATSAAATAAAAGPGAAAAAASMPACDACRTGVSSHRRRRGWSAAQMSSLIAACFSTTVPSVMAVTMPATLPTATTSISWHGDGYTGTIPTEYGLMTGEFGVVFRVDLCSVPPEPSTHYSRRTPSFLRSRLTAATRCRNLRLPPAPPLPRQI